MNKPNSNFLGKDIVSFQVLPSLDKFDIVGRNSDVS